MVVVRLRKCVVRRSQAVDIVEYPPGGALTVSAPPGPVLGPRIVSHPLGESGVAYGLDLEPVLRSHPI